MKQLLTLLLLVLGTSVFANTDKNTDPKPVTEGHETTACKKAAAKPAKVQETAVTKPAATTQKAYNNTGTSKACTTAEKSAFGITGYFADFVHRSNVKLVNMLID
jgi:hypothetical protein